MIYGYIGDVCRKGKGPEPNFECRRANNCDSIEENFKNQNCSDICMYDGHQPIFCCLPSITQTTTLNGSLIRSLGIANDKCRQYRDLFKKMYRCDRYSEFTCLTGECIPRSTVCNGNSDCPDGYDENDTLCKV
ncbi:Low-density lipoprotein (LDL) receptor class A repeat [Cinara cedri]|uniref:Low-density lipoprotein (LDL) receptor class A repeat n=1 Tax=Cinara cedri TaxID=506608 RepID=A0A5E4N9J4_9HEMI|nr:Low-density lipoprotein (LDL) receptor class A repeat [Cinara cedri]